MFTTKYTLASMCVVMCMVPLIAFQDRPYYLNMEFFEINRHLAR